MAYPLAGFEFIMVNKYSKYMGESSYQAYTHRPMQSCC